MEYLMAGNETLVMECQIEEFNCHDQNEPEVQPRDDASSSVKFHTRKDGFMKPKVENGKNAVVSNESSNLNYGNCSSKGDATVNLSCSDARAFVPSSSIDESCVANRSSVECVGEDKIQHSDAGEFRLKTEPLDHISSCNKQSFHIANVESNVENENVVDNCNNLVRNQGSVQTFADFIHQTETLNHITANDVSTLAGSTSFRYRKENETSTKEPGSGGVNCAFCNKYFTHLFQLRVHTSLLHCHNETTIGSYLCPICGIPYTKMEYMKRHMGTHEGVMPYECPNCPKKFSTQKRLTCHMHSHTKKTFNCPECGERYLELSDLKIHQTTHTTIKPDPCPICNKSFQTMQSFKIHFGRHKTMKTTAFECHLCHKMYHSQLTLSRHMDIHGERVGCPDCGKTFSTKKCMASHRLTHLGLKPFSCVVCGKKFAKLPSLKEHRMSHTGERPFECPNCPERFTSRLKLRNHLRKHTGEKPHICECCNKKFRQQKHLKLHLRIHTGEQPYECLQCEEKFRTGDMLRSHTRKFCPAGIQPSSTNDFECPSCDERFCNQSEFLEHLKTHTGPKRYSCKICDKAFKFHSALKLHMNLHDGSEPHACEFCDKRFRIPSQLKYHLRAHNKEKQHECHECGKKFCSKSRLKSHSKQHEVTSFECPECREVFHKKLYLTLHLKKGHDASACDSKEICIT